MTDTSESLPHSDNLCSIQGDVVTLGYEYRGHGFIQCSTIHVDSGSHRQHKSTHSPVNHSLLLKTPHSDRKCG